MLLLIIFVFVGCYLFVRLTCGYTKSSTCLNGKTAIVTGGAKGIGYEVALNLASRGCRVIIADITNLEEARDAIKVASNNFNIEIKKLDLSSLKSVRAFAGEIIKTESRLDILINNAGVCGAGTKHTEDGLHPIMQINSFGHFLLTHLLMNLLKSTDNSRIIFTTAYLAFIHKLDLGILNFIEGHPNSIMINSIIYANSMLVNIILSNEFASKLQGANVTCNAVHPGAVGTEFFKSFAAMDFGIFLIPFWNFFMMVYGKSAWEGAQTTVHVAVSKDLEKTSGKHFWDCKEFFVPPKTKDAQFCKLVWKACENYVGLKDSEKL